MLYRVALRPCVRLLALVCILSLADAAVPRPVAPNVAISTTDQKKIYLRQYRGKMVMLVMFSTTCDDCLKTLNLMGKFQKEYGPRGLQVIAAAINDNAAYSVQSFAQRYRQPFPIGYLNREDAIKMLDITPNDRPFVPIVMFIDYSGTVRVQYFGNDPIFKQEEKAFRAITDSLLKFNAANQGK
jgi:peroxiredoxin